MRAPSAPIAIAWIGFALLSMAVLVLDAKPAQANQCVAITRQQGQEVLVNSCGSCRTVDIERRRPGMEKPTSHSYTLPSGTPLPLSFRGPGSTRISAEKPCDNTPAPQGNANADDGKECVTFQQNPKAGPVMLNGCNACRLVVLARIDAAGGEKFNRYTVVANSYVPVRAEGAASARIVSDGPCPR